MATTSSPPPSHAIPAAQPASLSLLPTEVLLHCLSFLGPADLARVASASHSLRKHAIDDRLWRHHVNLNLPAPLTNPQPYSSFRQLYRAHHPHWFLVRNQVWIADQSPCGQLVIAAYNPSTGKIEGHTVVAERGIATTQPWSQDPEIMVIGFDPEVKLHLEAPVLSLDGDCFSSRENGELPMDCASPNSPGLRNSLVYCRDYPQEQLTLGSAVWPSMMLPAPGRTLNLTVSDFTSSSHRPKRTGEISESTFRVRKWVEYHDRRQNSEASRFQAIDRLAAANGMQIFAAMNNAPQRSLNPERRGDRVTTFGTLDPEAYTPTPQKPWRGIWCGDYSEHGCEFLLILHLDDNDKFEMPSGLNWLMEWLTGARRQDPDDKDIDTLTMTRMNEIVREMDMRDTLAEHEGVGDAPTEPESRPWLLPEDREVSGDVKYPTVVDPEETYTGKLVAVKLTGDPYVPKGEISFIAPDLRKGYVRTATDDLFRGARVVRSAGHLANNGFIFDEYIPSELILVSHDTLAQHWSAYGCISFFRRVDVGALLAQRQRS